MEQYSKTIIYSLLIGSVFFLCILIVRDIFLLKRRLALNKRRRKFKKILWKQNNASFLSILFIFCICLLVYRFSQSFYSLLYGIILITSILLIIQWCLKWFQIKDHNGLDIDKVSKKYDVQFKRLAKYFLFLFLLYIVYGVVEFREKNKGFYLNEISVSKSFESYGYDKSTLKMHLQEIKEEIYDYEYRFLSTKRFSLNSLPSKTADEDDVNFQVQGFGFPLKNLGHAIGEKLWGDQKKYIDISLTEDSISFKVSVSITNEPVMTFEDFFDDNFNRQLCIQNVLSKTEFYILEVTEPTLASIYYSTKGENDRALSILSAKKDTVFDDSNFNYFRNKGLTYSDLNNYEEAKKIFDRLLLAYPNNTALLNDRGLIELRLNNDDNAQKYFDKALLIDSNSHYPCYNKSAYFKKRNNIDSAIYYLVKSISDKQGFSYSDSSAKIATIFEISLLYRNKKDFKNSEYYFIEACNSSPYTYDMLLNGWPLIDMSQEGNYRLRLKEFYMENKNYVPTILGYALCFGDSIPENECEELLRKCLDKYPNLIPAQLKLASIVSDKKMYSISDSLLNKTISIQPDNFVAYYLKGINAQYLGNHLKAESYIKKSLSLYKFYWPSFNALIDILNLKGSTNEILSLCQRYYMYDSYNDVCNYNLGYYYYLKPDYDKAIYYLSKTQKYTTNKDINANSVSLLADCFYEIGDYKKAIENYIQEIQNGKRNKPSIETLIRLRQCYIQTNCEEKIKEIEEKFRKENISFDERRTVYY